MLLWLLLKIFSTMVRSYNLVMTWFTLSPKNVNYYRLCRKSMSKDYRVTWQCRHVWSDQKFSSFTPCQRKYMVTEDNRRVQRLKMSPNMLSVLSRAPRKLSVVAYIHHRYYIGSLDRWQWHVVPEADAKQLVAAPIKTKWKLVNINFRKGFRVSFSKIQSHFFMQLI
jgi:hypothetical protein